MPLNISLQSKLKTYSEQGKYALEARNIWWNITWCHHKEAMWMKPTHLDYLPDMVNKFKQERGHKLRMKRTRKKKKGPPTNGLSVDEDINL
jgi:hypothetical protein